MILLLFPVHTFMIWNDFGSKFYVWGGGNRWISTLIVLINPWFMPVLFAIAGVCARYSLEKRSPKEFVGERVRKLLLPFVSGMVLLVPIQTLFARKFFDGYEGGILENLAYFFTHVTDLSGYDGGFTPGHLWFLLFLFVISLVALLVCKFLPYVKVADSVSKINFGLLMGLFVPVWLLYYIGNFGGFSLGKNFALYIIGYYVLSNDSVLERLERNFKWIAGIYGVSQLALAIAYHQWAFYGDLAVNFVGWSGVLFWFIAGKRWLNRETKGFNYFKKASFPIYILHQSILVAVGYYTLLLCDDLPLQMAVILVGSFVLTVFCYQVIRHIPYLRCLFGIKS